MERFGPRGCFQVDYLGDNRMMVEFSVDNAKLLKLGNLRILGRWLDSDDSQSELGINNRQRSRRTEVSLDIAAVIKDENLSANFCITPENIVDVGLVVEEGRIAVILTFSFGSGNFQKSYVFDVANFQAEPSFQSFMKKTKPEVDASVEESSGMVSRVRVAVMAVLTAAFLTASLGSRDYDSEMTGKNPLPAAILPVRSPKRRE